jgi:signal transduction histidine kinase
MSPWMPSAKVMGVESELSRLVINLFSNALLHTPCGGLIRVVLEQRHQVLSLSICDSGPGIAAAEQGRIFDRFTRLDPSRSQLQGGTGLGLAIAQAIAKRNGATISVQSTPGEGAVFRLQLAAIVE